jgi:hypothetical protein
LTERSVQTFKGALRKLCDQSSTKDDWDIQLAYALSGYRFSKQESTKLSPYEIIFARSPVLPTEFRLATEVLLDCNIPKLAIDSVVLRAELARKYPVIAADNLFIAQHRDRRRYETVNSGGFKPRTVRILAGDFVYRQAPASTTLHPSVGPDIYQVVSVTEQGAVTLQGRDGGTFKDNVIGLAPCHVPVETGVLAHEVEVEDDFACEICGKQDNAWALMLCGGCAKGHHIYCLSPPLSAVPTREWICPACEAAGLTLKIVAERKRVADRLRKERSKTVGVPKGTDQRRALHGRWCIQSRERVEARWGKVRYLGEAAGARCLEVHFCDGAVVGPYAFSTFNSFRWLLPAGQQPSDRELKCFEALPTAF